MNRTEELMANGGIDMRTKVGGGDGERHSFIKWTDEPAWLEEEALKLWEGDYGENVTMKLSNCSDNLVAKEGGEMVSIQAGTTVNVGIHSATLKGSITEEDVDGGKHFHVAFMRWSESAKGTRYRSFAVGVIKSDDDAVGESKSTDTDDLPF